MIIGHCKIAGFKSLQALSMGIVLPSYAELTNSLTTMATAFEAAMMSVEEEECARLIHYLVLGSKGDKK